MPLDPILGNSSDGTLGHPVLKPGDKLFKGQYELLDLLGAGGMGQVWRARDVAEGTDVALKFLPGLVVLQPAEMQRLKEEVAVGKTLRHDHLVATYGLEVESNLAAIVMEYVPGQTLKEKLETHPRGFFEPEELHTWLADIAEALDYLHMKKQRLHRDVKPANIMIDVAGRARLIDFGISHQIKSTLSRHGKTGASAGPATSSTLAYAAPQQLAGDPGTAADDLYSLGATLYELLSSTPPFFRGAPEIVAYQIKNEPPASIHTRRREQMQAQLLKSTGSPIPAHTEKTIMACLEKQREKRPASAGEVHRRFTGQQTVTPHIPIWRIAAVVCFAGACWIFLSFLAGLFLSNPRRIITEVPKLVEDTASRQEAAQQRQRADELEKKHQEEEQKRLAAEAEAKKAREDAAKAALPPPVVPRAVPVGTPATATKSIPFENSLGMKFVPVPIGAGESKGQRMLFSIWETRSRDYAAFMKSGSYTMSGTDADVWKTSTFGDAQIPVGRGAGETVEESSHPVANVSHDDAAAFCAWLTKKDRASGKIGPKDEYRLPTDMEWSYAVGIGEKEDAIASTKAKSDPGLPGIYPWGGSYPPTTKVGNYFDEDAKAAGLPSIFTPIKDYHDGYATTAPVGSYPPNGLGIHDLGGNLWEWTSSVYEPGSDRRVLRGASWLYGVASGTLSSSRDINDSGGRINLIGFRCVLVVGGDAHQEAKSPAVDKTKQTTTLETRREMTKAPASPEPSKTPPSAPVKVQPSSNNPTPAEHMQRQADEIGSMLERARAQLNNR